MEQSCNSQNSAYKLDRLWFKLICALLTVWLVAGLCQFVVINRNYQNLDNNKTLQYVVAIIEPAINAHNAEAVTQAFNSINHYDKQVLTVKVQDSLGKPVVSWSLPSALPRGPAATLTHKIRLTAQPDGVISITRLQRQDSLAENGMPIIQLTLFGALLTITLLTAYYLNAFAAERTSRIRYLTRKKYPSLTAGKQEPTEHSFLSHLSQLSDEILQINAEVNKLNVIERDLSAARQSASNWQNCFESLAESAKNGIVIIDNAGRIKFINNTVKKLLEWEENDVYDSDFFNLVQDKYLGNGNAELLECLLISRQCVNKEDSFWTKSKLPISVN